ncbi:MAG: EamA/RhaT family transporter [Rubripirellula sp.]|jgi:drug/metabolite transporter (DMT)-like permease|nr:EamA/RhaT family transporter [Rubripirellula sp.]MDA8697706.1 EamA/RhaT family transporter [Rhodopirellula sp.]
MHLLLPLLASLLFVGALIFMKRAGEAGADSLTTLCVSNLGSGIIFSIFWSLGGTFRGWQEIWQPAIIASLFVLGLMFTFMAIEKGDVSIATPIFGVKVVFVAMLVTILGIQDLPPSVWQAAIMATLGIALIQWTGRGKNQRVALTIALAIAAALSYATFDVLVQRWAPAWGIGRFLPIVYWMVGLSSLPLIPRLPWREIRQPKILFPLSAGALLISLQAICIVSALAVFGDAARVNVVYSLRGLWGVLLAWAVAKRWGGSEADHTHRTMLTRLAGAIILAAAVALVVLSEISD